MQSSNYSEMQNSQLLGHFAHLFYSILLYKSEKSWKFEIKNEPIEIALQF